MLLALAGADGLVHLGSLWLRRASGPLPYSYLDEYFAKPGVEQFRSVSYDVSGSFTEPEIPPPPSLHLLQPGEHHALLGFPGALPKLKW
jgi:hypothetical protein